MSSRVTAYAALAGHLVGRARHAHIREFVKMANLDDLYCSEKQHFSDNLDLFLAFFATNRVGLSLQLIPSCVPILHKISRNGFPLDLGKKDGTIKIR